MNKDIKKPVNVVKFRPINKHTKELFINKKLFFGNVKDFNDPFEFAMNFSNKNGQSVIYHSFRNAFSVFSVCEEETINNILLWSHYANNHRGICIVFTPNYNDKESPFYELEPVSYLNEVPVFNEGTKDDAKEYLELILSTKAKCWEYEKEWRIIKFSNEGEVVKETLSNGLEINCGCYYKFSPPELTKIIIGCKVNDEDERIVLNWIEELENYDIKVERCLIDEEKYKLKFIQII